MLTVFDETVNALRPVSQTRRMATVAGYLLETAWLVIVLAFALGVGAGLAIAG